MIHSNVVRNFVDGLESVSNFIDSKPYGDVKTMMLISGKRDELEFKIWFYNQMSSENYGLRTMERVYQDTLLSSLDALSALKRKIEWEDEISRDMI